MTKTPTTTSTSSCGDKATKGPTSFQFVTFSDIDHMRDAAAISNIRRHAMKDIGRQRRRPRKKRFIEIPIEVPEDFASAPVPAIGGGGVHTFFPIPVELDRVGEALLANIWREKGDCLFDAHRQDWFNVGLDDPATFNQILANSELHLEATKNPDKLPRETATSMHYHQLAVSNVRNRIAEGELSTQVLGCITGLLVYTEIAGAYERWLPQRKGLLSIIESFEGDISGVEEIPHLRAAVSWVELRGCFRQDIPSAIPLPIRWLQVAQTLRKPSSYCPFEETSLANDMRCPLVRIFKDLNHLGILVDSHLHQHRHDEAQGANLIVWTNVMAHQLLSLRPLESDFDKINNSTRLMLESWRLAMLTLIGMIYQAYGAHPLSSTTYVEKQHQLLSKNKIDWDGFIKMKLWIIFLAALEAGEDTARRRWFIMELVTTAADEGNETYPELEERVRSVLWMSSLFDGRTAMLRKDIERTA